MSQDTPAKNPEFDAAAVLDTVRREREERRHRRTWGKSKLVRHRAELVKLRQAGASLADISHWLKAEKRLKADKSTIARYLATLPEMRSDTPPSEYLPNSELERQRQYPRPGGEDA